MDVIDNTSKLVDFVIEIENWNDIFGDKLPRKFPYLIQTWVLPIFTIIDSDR